MSNELTPLDNPAASTAAIMLSPQHMQAMISFADLMAQSAVTVPKHLQGKPADCMAIAMQAAQWGMNPFAVAQKTHIVNGTLGYEAQLVNAVIQSSRAIVGAFSYEYQGDGPRLQCRVGAVLRGQTAITWGEWLCGADVTTKNSPLWKVNPKQQLGYLQVKNWSRLYCPGAILGFYTTDELQDIAPAPAPQTINPSTGEITPARFDLSAEKNAASDCTSVDDLREYLRGAFGRAVAAKDKMGGAAIKAYVLELVEMIKAQAVRDAATDAPMKEVDSFVSEMESAEVGA